MKSGGSSCLLTTLAVSYNQQNVLSALLGDNVKGVVKAEPFHCLTTPHSPSYPVPNVSEDGEEYRVKSRWEESQRVFGQSYLGATGERENLRYLCVSENVSSSPPHPSLFQPKMSKTAANRNPTVPPF